MCEQAVPCRKLAAALSVSAALHVLLFTLPFAPPSGSKRVEASPAGMALNARLVRPAAPLAPTFRAPAAEPVAAETQTKANEERHPVDAPAPRTAIASEFAPRYWSSSEVDVRAQPIDPPALLVPEFIIRDGVRGKVALLVFISAEGSVDAVEVVSSTHPGRLEEAAIAVTRATRFSPAVRGGVPVRNSKKIEVIFDPYEPAPS